MRISMVIVAALLCLPFVACQQDCDCEERSVGYVNNVEDLKDAKWHIGTEASIEVYEKYIDAANAMDKDALMALFADSAVIGLSNGFEMHGKDSIEAGISRWLAWADTVQYETMFALSADLKPDTLGEWVFAGADHRQVAGDDVVVDFIQMNIYVIDGLIHQFWTSRTDTYEADAKMSEDDGMEEDDMDAEDMDDDDEEADEEMEDSEEREM